MLCVPEMFFSLSGCCGRCMLHVCGVYALHTCSQRTGRGVTNLGRRVVLLCRWLRGGACDAFVWTRAIAFHDASARPTARYNIELRGRECVEFSSRLGIFKSTSDAPSLMRLAQKQDGSLLCAREMRIQEELWNEWSNLSCEEFRWIRETAVSTCPPRGNLVDGLPRAPTWSFRPFRIKYLHRYVFVWAELDA